MKLGRLLLSILYVVFHAGLKVASQDTQTLRGRLVLVDRDFRPNGETSAQGSTGQDTHYVLVGSKKSVWSLSFPPGRQPPVRPGLQLEVDVPATELESATAGLTSDGSRRRSLLVRRVITSPSPAAKIGDTSKRPVRSRNSTCHRRLNPGEACNRLHDKGSMQLPDAAYVPQQEVGDDDAGPAAGRSTGVIRPSKVNSSDVGRLLSEAGAQQRGGGSLTVLRWRQVPNRLLPDAGTREAPLVQDPDPSASTYNNDGRIVMDDVSTVVYILDMCGQGPAASPEDLEALLFGEDDITLESYLSYCSSGKAKFSRANVLIVGPVEVPCSDSYMIYYDGDPEGWEAFWYTSSCRPQDYVGWLRYAQQWARDNGYDIDAYRHHVALVSPNQGEWMNEGDGRGGSCDWPGMAFVGPYSDDSDVDITGGARLMTYRRGVYGYAWINGDFWYEATGWAHELAHNYYVKHAFEKGCEYCDATCALGYCCAMRCFNAPHMWQLGWREPLATFGFSGLPIGVMVQRSLTASPSSTPLSSAIRIEANYWSDPWAMTDLGIYNLWQYTPYLWVAYRKESDPFDNLPDMPNNVHIYLMFEDRYSGSISGTIKLMTLQIGDRWRNAALGLHVQVVNMTSNSRGQNTATVKLCRMEAEVEDTWRHCYDGIDNDCDGFIDQEDEDCLSSSYNNRDYDFVSTPTSGWPGMEQPPPPPPPPPPSPPPPPPPPVSELPSSPTPSSYIPILPLLPTYPGGSKSTIPPVESSPAEQATPPEMPSPAAPSFLPNLYPPMYTPPSIPLISDEPLWPAHTLEPDPPGVPEAPSLPSPPPRRRSMDNRVARAIEAPVSYGAAFPDEHKLSPPCPDALALSRRDRSLATGTAEEGPGSGARRTDMGEVRKNGVGARQVPSAIQHLRSSSKQQLSLASASQAAPATFPLE
ncbi:hypothetical protein VaNZ11_008405 [Volvox africanus]|uniref:Peptidase M11 gametolysin domain-containing protein n=1 Tax=Volvox africanus TaxID=51714 RepID=A0ABQ5S555_9CHLO|nr:hypothetical protein VaNZ11_008405 [Volvox africanus]